MIFHDLVRLISIPKNEQTSSNGPTGWESQTPGQIFVKHAFLFRNKVSSFLSAGLYNGGFGLVLEI